MASARGVRRIFTIAPGVNFLSVFARRFLDGALVPDFPDRTDPLSLSRATIFVPTTRAAQALAREFVAASGRRMALLPTIAPLGRLETLEPEFSGDAFDSDEASAREPSEISDIERQLALTSLVRAWAKSLRSAVVASSDRALDSPFPLVGGTLGDAWSLARELATLIDEFAIEGASWDALDGLTPSEFDAYWDITRRFLSIAGDEWPGYLKQRRLIEGYERQARFVDAIARRCADPAADPMLIVGSTGANPTTARLIAAVAAAPRGAIVLPGLDLDLDDLSWALLTGAPDAGAEPPATHPQTAMARLLREIDTDRSDVIALDEPSPAASRNRIVSDALRPPETTDQWRARHSDARSDEITRGLDGVALATATDEHEEALCIAVKLRECVELGKRAALATPDRKIARRVQGHMARWGLDIADSGGEPLRSAMPGSLARLALDAAAAEATNVEIAALLSHPLVGFAFEPHEFEMVRRHAEIAVLRVRKFDMDRRRESIAAARAACEQRDAHPNARALQDSDWARVGLFFDAFVEALAPLRTTPAQASIATWARAHAEAIRQLAAQSRTADADGQFELDAMLQGLGEHGELGGDIEFADYVALFDRIGADVVVRRKNRFDERVVILGLLEARLLHFDCLVLAGLDEGVWPPLSQTGAFLNRSMRMRLGLSPPERRIGQTAHDFAQAMGAPEVLIVRAQKRGGAPTVPSRFVQRLDAYAGAAWSHCAALGQKYVDLARALDRMEGRRAAAPAPRPRVELRPTSLSVTRIETLRRDPYSIYAERILRLRPVEPLVEAPGAREHGIALHATISLFARQFHRGAARDDLTRIARHEFADFAQTPGFEEFVWPDLMRVLDAYFQWETESAKEVSGLEIEKSGEMPVRLVDGSDFRLTAVADRIESRADGMVSLYDFKSGRIPTANEIEAGFAPQLVLEACMASKGAFGIPAARDVEAVYVKLGGSEGLTPRKVGARGATLHELMARQFDGLVELLSQFRAPETPYLSRPFPRFLLNYGVYDHLARVKEWSVGGEEDAAS